MSKKVHKSNIKEDRNGTPIGRRDFLVTIGTGAIGLAAVGSVAGTYEYLLPNALLEPAMMFKAGSPEDYPEGVDNRWLDRQRVFIIKRRKNLYALVGICTHLGCIPPWRENEGVFHCPCHGSKFSMEGDVLRGPAREPLYRPPIEVKADGNLRVGTGLLGIRLPQQANLQPERSGKGFVLTV
ncbi:MAG: ubiquinol-cytochrome c reductase iron-sulfur subunit [bacterium]